MAIFGDLLGPAFAASRVQRISDLHSKFAQGHTMCPNMVDILSATAEIRRGKKKEERKKKPQDENVISASAKQGGHNNVVTTAAKYNGLPITMYGHNKRALLVKWGLHFTVGRLVELRSLLEVRRDLTSSV